MPVPKIQFLKGVGPKRAALLAELGVDTPRDLLAYYPRAWQDRRLPGDAEKGAPLEEALVFRGKVLSARELRTSKALVIFKAVLSNGKYEVEASWFKRFSWRYDVFASLKKEVREGAEIWVIGKPEDPLFPGPRIRVEEHYPASAAAEAVHVNRIVPVYPLTEGLSGRFMREAVRSALAQMGGETPECLPEDIRSRRALASAAQAERGIHFPRSLFELEAARKRLAYEELFLMALAWGIKRRQLRAAEKEHRYELRRHLLTPFREALSFEFTPSQKKVINEIFDDMLSPRPMARLLQGDVGSGKTVVALSALLLAAENGRQGLFMAPTEILAEQHALTFERLLKGLPVRWALLTSSVKGPARKKILEDAAEGRLDILIGTHALIEESVKLRTPGLVVVDEQHRFGVRQRAALRAKGDRSDALIMTATPIPRTLALALYGDLDVSTLTDMPPGRKPVRTESLGEEKAFREARLAASVGRQVYIVYPLIEESGTAGLKAVTLEFERLREVFKGYTLGILHGRMKPEEKRKAMEDFAAGRTRVLAATQVIEVGIDVPNATVMVINNAERFGLSSLHQLRGRVGRGAHESRCLLVADLRADGARERVQAMCSTTDGFLISEKDLALRGGGDPLGLRQHGDLDLRLADLSRDSALLRQAVEDRDAVLEKDPRLALPEHGPLKARLLALYGARWDLIELS